MNRTDMNKQIRGYKTGRKVRKKPEKNENTGGSEDLKRGVPRTTDVAGSKKFKNRGGGTRGGRDFRQMLEGFKKVPGSGYMTRDPKTGKEMPASLSSDLATKRRREKIGEEIPFFKKSMIEQHAKKMDPSVAAHQDKLQKMSPSDIAMYRAKKLDTSAEKDFKKGGKVKGYMGGGMMKYKPGGSVKSGKPKGCGIARQGVKNATMITMKGS